MITLSIAELLEDKFDLQKVFQPFHQLYIIRDEGTVFYIGNSDDILERLREHAGIARRHYDISKVAQLILRNKPGSLCWKINLMTIEDCMPFVRDAFPGFSTENDCSPRIAEMALILAYSPCLNIAHNPNPNPLPERYLSHDAGQGGLEAIRQVMDR